MSKNECCSQKLINLAITSNCFTIQLILKRDDLLNAIVVSTQIDSVKLSAFVCLAGGKGVVIDWGRGKLEEKLKISKK